MLLNCWYELEIVCVIFVKRKMIGNEKEEIKLSNYWLIIKRRFKEYVLWMDLEYFVFYCKSSFNYFLRDKG